MISLIVSGEGVTDLGVSESGQGLADESDILPGPMLVLIYKLIRLFSPEWYQDLIDWEQRVPIPTCLVNRQERSRVSKDLKPNLFQTHKYGRGGIEHSKSAWALAALAKEKDSNLMVYFHDTDGTRSVLRDTPNLQEVIVSAAHRGFDMFPEKCGVAMVPKPTSEAWLLCHSRNKYIDCPALEVALAGNQDSPERSPKVILKDLIGDTDRESLEILAGEIDPARLDMPSFHDFANQMNAAIQKIFAG